MILASTTDYLVEHRYTHLTIARRSDGRCKELPGPKTRTEFMRCLDSHDNQEVIDCFLRLTDSQRWMPMYKPRNMPVHLDFSLTQSIGA